MRGWIVVVVLALLVGSMTTRAADAGAPDFATLRAAGQATAAKLHAGPAATWKVTSVNAATKVTMTADVLDAPGCRRIVFWIQRPSFPKVQLGTLFETPSAWYYTDVDGRRRKHRPHEVELPRTMTSTLRAFAGIRVVTDGDDPTALGRFAARHGDVARYLVPAQDQATFRDLLSEFDELTRTDPAAAAKDVQSQETAAFARRALTEGLPVGIDVRTGIMTEFTVGEMAFTVSAFRYLPALLPDELNPESQRWEDYTDDPTAKARPDDLVMLSYAPMWRPGGPLHEPSAVLLDLATGRLRRIPFEGVQAIPGCFVKDRSAVIVPGMDVDGAPARLYRIDLKTRANRRLGGDALAGGTMLMPALSPDGRSVAVLHNPAFGATRGTRVVVVDLETDAVRTVGPAVDGSHLSWLPDGKGFVLRMRADASTDGRRRICRMDLDGKVTLVCDGNSPTVLASRKAIAFEADDHTWHLCDLDGANPRPLNTGGAPFSGASPSPDGSRMLMLDPGARNGPAPAVYDLSTQTHRFLQLPRGLWAYPAWR